MNEEEIKKVLELHKKWLNDEDGGVKANLRWAHLHGAHLTKANLRQAHLHGAHLHGANLSGADLTKADLTEADLSWANLTKANLSGVDLSGANLRWANLTEADLTGANLDYASFPLQCTSTKMIVDEKIFLQLLYHAIKLCPKEHELRTMQVWRCMAAWANKFHNVEECGRIE